MALQLITPLDKFELKRGIVDRRAVIGHLESVLKIFAAKPEYGQFYIGITGNLEDRLARHRGTRPDFKLMVPIYSEPAHYMDDSFDKLEHAAISAFRGGIVHPETKQLLLRCDNGPGGAAPKSYLYILVG